MDYMQLVKDVAAKAAANGAEAEAYLEEQSQTEIKVDRGEVEQLSQSGSLGLGVRVIKNGQTGYAYTSDLSDEGVGATIKAAVELAEVATPDENRSLPDPQPITEEDLKLFDPGFDDITADQKINFLKQVEQAALNYDKRVIMTNMTTYGDQSSTVYLANSKGFAGSYRNTAAYSFLMGVAKGEDGMMNAMNLAVGQSLHDLDAGEIGAGAGKRAVQLLDGKQVPTQKTTVVFDALVTGELLGYLAMAMTAQSMQRGRSFLVDKIGQDIASDKVTLLDNGRLPGGWASAPFDAEGVPTKATRLIDEGVFQTVIYDSYTARQDGVESTGNARRGSHRDMPTLAPSNFMMQPGHISQEDLFAGIEQGLYVTTIMQTGGINPVNGDCSMAANGLWIENGKLTKPVNGVTVATTLPELLKNISEVANDLRVVPFAGAVGAPTIRVDDVMVGGSEG